VRRLYYHDTILILSNDCWYIFRMPFHSNILILSWYFDISKYQINCEILLLIVSWYFSDILILWYFDTSKYQINMRFCWYYYDIWYKNHNHHMCSASFFKRLVYDPHSLSLRNITCGLIAHGTRNVITNMCNHEATMPPTLHVNWWNTVNTHIKNTWIKNIRLKFGK